MKQQKKKKHVLTVHILEEEWKALKTLASAEDRSVSAYMRGVVRQIIKE